MSNTYHTVEELRKMRDEEERKKSFSSFEIGDNKPYHTVEEIRKEAARQGIYSALPKKEDDSTSLNDKPQHNINNTSSIPTRNASTPSLAPWADKNSANSLPSTYEMYKKNLRDPKVQQDYQTKSEATKLLSDAAGKMQYSTSEIKTSLEQSKEAAAKKGENTAAYDKALEMLTEYSNNNAYKTPEELQKEIDSTPFDYHNKEDIKKALGAGENQDELADYYMKYRAGVISSSDGRDDAKFKGLNELIEPRVLNTSVQKSTDKSHEVAYTGEDGKSVNFGTLIAQRVSENRQSDLTASKEKAGATLGYLGSGSRNLTNGYKASTEDMQSAGWDSQYTYAAYQVDGDTEQKSAVFSPVVLNEKGEVQKILTPDELEKYAKESLSSDSDPLHLQATETYNGFYGTSLARENAKRINRLSERYFNDTDLEGLVAATNNTTPGTTPESREEAKAKAAQYGVDLDELEHYGYIENVKSEKEKASKAYADWSDDNVATGAVATGANIVASPLKAVEYGINLGESLHDVGKANENGGVLSSYKIPPTYDDFVSEMTKESTESITESIRKSIKSDGDNPFLNWLGDTAANTYGGVTSSVQSALTGATARALFGPGVGEAVALGIMSGEAANDTFNDVIDNGGTVGQAVTYSIAAGANEAIFEKVSLENLINIKDVVGKKGVKEALKSVITQGFTEASEEVCTELANRFADDVINTDKSEYNRNVQKYIDQGYSEDEAKSKANMDFVGQVMLAGYGGFIGGGFSAGGKVAINTVQENRQSRNTGAAITGAGNTQALIDKAKNSTDEAVVKQAEKVERLFQTRNEKNEKIGKEKSSRKLNKEAGTLYDMLQEREIEDTQSPLRTLHDELSEKIIAETGSENEDAVNVIIKSQLNRGAELTGSEQALLDTPVMQKIVNDSQDLFRKASDSTAQAWQSMGETSALMQKTNQDYDTFDPTDDGLTYINGQNTPVEVSKVTAVTGGNYDVELTNGSTVKASELDFGDSAVPAILSGMLDTQEKHGTQMSPEFVNSAVKLWQEGGYNPGSLNGYITDAQEAFYAGNSNNTEYKPQVMSQGAYDALYKAAAETKSAAITAKGTQIEANKTATRREGAVLFKSADGTNVNISSSRDMARQGIHLNDLQKVGIDMVINLAKSTGLTFRFFQSERNSDGIYVSKYSEESNGKQKASPNGFYKNGEIYVDINAGSYGEGLIMFTVSHELVHFMRDFAPEQFDKFAGFLFASYAKKGLSVRGAVHQEMMAHQSLKYDEAYEEVVARLSESFLRDAHLSEKSKALYNADKSLWQSIKDGLEKVINKIKEAFADIAPESQLGKIGQKMVRENQEILDRFVAGIREAAENAAYTENTTESEKDNTSDKKSNSEKEDIRYQERGDQTYTQEEVDEYIRKEREEADKRIKEVLDEYKKKRHESVEKRNKTKVRHSVMKKSRELNKLLNRSAKEKTVKQGLRESTENLLKVSSMLFPESLTVEEMAAEGVGDATAQEQKALDRYNKLLKNRAKKDITQRVRDNINAQLKHLRNNDLKDLITRERKRYEEASREANSLYMKEALTELSDAFKKTKDAKEFYIRDAFNENGEQILDLIDEFKETVGDKLAKNLSLNELLDFNKIVTMMTHTIRKANTLFVAGRKATLTEAGDSVINEITAIRMPKKGFGDIRKWTADIGISNLKPIYLARYIGSETLEELVWKIQQGELISAVDIEEAKQFKQDCEKKWNYKTFDFKKELNFEASNGRKFELNLNQRMEIYAMSRREQGLQHLLGFGYTFEKGSKVNGKYQTGVFNYPLTTETINQIADSLSANEKGYAEEMQSYLSTVMAEKGNQVSMALFGVRLFNEDIYWSLISDSNYTSEKEENNPNKKFKLKNSGFTKQTNRKANNPVVLKGFEESWCSHVFDMATYHGMVLPLEDFTRVLKYQTRVDMNAKSVSGILDGTYIGATEYFDRLIADLNGGAVQKNRVKGADKWISRSKKTAVLGNLSVVLQQPSAIFRAMAYVNPKYFAIGGIKGALRFGAKYIPVVNIDDWEDLKKYAPIAIIKEMGGFDTTTGYGAMDYLKSGKPTLRENLKDIRERGIKEHFTTGHIDGIAKRTSDRVDELLSKAPELADRLAWIQLWNAIQRETKAKHGCKIGTKENKEISGKRFNEVVHLTQVYDSTLSRSDNMRSKGAFEKMVTSFMAEPLVYANMMLDAAVQAKRTNGFWKSVGTFSQVAGACATALIVNSLLHAIAVAMRDDDDEDDNGTFGDKYWKAFWGDILDGVNPLNYLPIARDIMSLLEGYDTNRMDMTLFSNVIKTVKKLIKKSQKGESYDAWDYLSVFGSVVALKGIPMNNLIRDIRSVINTYSVIRFGGNNALKDATGLNAIAKYQNAYDNAWDKGYSEEDCKKKADQAARAYISKEIKPEYYKALSEKNYEKANDLRSFMHRSGVYKDKYGRPSLSTVDDLIEDWKDEAKEKAKQIGSATQRRWSK